MTTRNKSFFKDTEEFYNENPDRRNSGEAGTAPCQEAA